jgi:hypothetical protein
MFLTCVALSNVFEILCKNFNKAQLVWDLAAFGIPAVFHSDWALAMMTWNIVGLLSDDVAALYWSYFVGKNREEWSVCSLTCYSK